MNEIEARGKIKYRIANEMRKYGENKEEYEDLEIALQVMKEIREYREIGTVEELQKLKEKATSKQPIRKPNVSWTREEITCPTCGRYISEYRNSYCDCGQKLDWE